MNLDQILLIVVSAVLFVLWLVEISKRRRAELLATSLRMELNTLQMELNALRREINSAVRERNAANLRAQRAINSLRALPEVEIHCKLPADKVHTTTFNLN